MYFWCEFVKQSFSLQLTVQSVNKTTYLGKWTLLYFNINSCILEKFDDYHGKAALFLPAWVQLVLIFYLSSGLTF